MTDSETHRSKHCLLRMLSEPENYGNEYLKLVAELEALISTSSTQQTSDYQKLRRNLDSVLTDQTSVMKSTLRQMKNAQQFVVSAQSTLKSTTSGKEQEWWPTWLDSWIMSFHSSSSTAPTKCQRLVTQLKGSVVSAWELWDSMDISRERIRGVYPSEVC